MIDVINVLSWIFMAISILLMVAFMISIRFENAAGVTETFLNAFADFLKRHKWLEKFINLLYYTGMICFIVKGIILFVEWFEKLLRGFGLL